MFSVSKNKFNVLERFSISGLRSNAKKCGTEKDKYYFKTLSHFSKNDIGLEYHFNYLRESQDSGVWIVTIVPNNIGYTSLKKFKDDFALCSVGGNRYPSLITKNYLLFVSSYETGFDDGSGRPHGCNEIREFVEPTIELK